MGLMDGLLNAIKLNDEADEELYDDDSFLDDEDDKPEKGNRNASARNNDSASEDKKGASKVTPLRQQKRIIGAGMEVCVIKPTSVEDAREITETLLANRTVVLNMEGLDVDIAQRIIDFTSGSCYAIDGNLQKISHYIFIITPASVDISGDFQEILSGSFDVPSLNN